MLCLYFRAKRSFCIPAVYCTMSNFLDFVQANKFGRIDLTMTNFSRTPEKIFGVTREARD